MRNYVYAAVLILFLADIASAAGYTGAGLVTRISSISANGEFEVIGTWTNVDGCSSPAKFVVGAHSTATPQSQNAMYSMLLAAHMNGQTVELFVDGCNGANQPIVKSVWTPNRY